jgi:hypothetical protein
MTTDDSWTAEWSCAKLISHTNITSAKAVGSNEIELILKEDREDPVRVATMSRRLVTGSDLERVHTSTEIEFIMNIPKEAIFQRDAIEMSELLEFGLGGLTDLYVAAAEAEFISYIPKEFRFILRALRQHSSVSQVTRLNNRMLLIKSFSGEDKRLLALNEYDLTADAVRSGIDKFGTPDLILTSNPNCRPSSEAVAAAQSGGIDVYSIGELMSMLRK